MKTAMTAEELEQLYPSGDGQPMAETPIHVRAIMLLHQALEDFLLPRDPDVFIASDIFWYYREGRPGARVSPDVMVVPGAGASERRSFFSWLERVPTPAVVFEMASPKTWRSDIGPKFRRYQSLGVPEYFIFDALGRHFPQQLQGFRLRAGQYAPMRRSRGALSSALGFRLRAEGEMLRLFDPDDVPVPTRAERVEQERQRADAAQRRVEQEQRRANAAQQRVDQLQTEVERLKVMLRKYGHANGNGP